jgi:hypothetical protein
MSKNPFKTFFDDIHVAPEFSETLVDVELIEPGSETAPAEALVLPQFIIGTTSSGSTRWGDKVLFAMACENKPFVYVDPKASIYPMSRRKAKKRLMAAGLRPAEANALIREIAGQACLGFRLRAAMKHHFHKGKDWFPWDTCVH